MRHRSPQLDLPAIVVPVPPRPGPISSFTAVPIGVGVTADDLQDGEAVVDRMAAAEVLGGNRQRWRVRYDQSASQWPGPPVSRRPERERPPGGRKLSDAAQATP